MAAIRVLLRQKKRNTDMSDYDGAEHMEEEPAQQQPRIKSTVVGGKKKGRGFHEPDRGEDGNAPYESLQLEGQGGENGYSLDASIFVS